ncbi:type VI secretion system-associated protein TagF [Variovorax sp. PAMC 28711]|uniref:type VI secretion system-associated protein TagF n=1 Tax=Variovorax sp. PAMC 28711 TaxID=1795631 RepID=UPI00078BE47C|nr:type VI secretion system-associated protein TagF [Variovorax sp. PAMC 28711]AMM25098.1 type VI secretion protein [Variovorax sp. PAMC 28711]
MLAPGLPGWFGKLPGMGDFAHRRLPDGFRARLDDWLHDGLLRLRERHDDWTVRYLEGPLWFFALGEGVAGAPAWLGVLMPSVDGVGRYFPFLVAVECDAQEDAAAAWAWWRMAAAAALEGLADDLDAVRFDAALQRRLEAGAVPDEGAVRDIAWPARGGSLWLTDPAVEQGLVMRANGLPADGRFDALFGFASDEWVETVASA